MHLCEYCDDFNKGGETCSYSVGTTQEAFHISVVLN